MSNRKILIFLTIAAFLAVCILDVSFGRRLGRGGGRGFSRSGIASRGGFSGRRIQRPQRQYRAPVNRKARVSPRGQVRPVAQGSQNHKRPQNVQKRKNRVQGGSNRMATGSQNRISPEKRQQMVQNRKGGLQDRMAQKGGNLEDRQEWRDKNREDIQKEIRERQEKRQEFAKDRQEDRQDFIEDIHDDHHDWDDHWDGDGGEFAAGVIVGGVVVGAAAAARANDHFDEPQAVYNNTTTYVTTLPCQPREVKVKGVTYFNCGNDWYQRSYAGSEITFIPVSPPPGY